ncbi:MAG: response regulator [Nitrospinae bacterium]|nr:response regulator [Nitrospinota bacterium]
MMLDYMLGDGTGIELIPNAKGIPVIFVTGSGDEHIAVNAMKMGAYDYLIKDPERHYLTILPQTVETVMARKKSEDTVRQLSSVVEQTADAVTITGRDGFIQYVNPAFSRLTGYSAEEARGNTPAILKSEHHPPEFYKNLWDTILSGNTFHAEVHNRAKNGAMYIEEKSITPIKDKQGEITHFVSTGRDITERKRAEEELRNAKENAEEATRLKDKFVSLVSHDLRGPLATMIGFLKLMVDDADDPLSADAAKRISIVIDSAEKMNELIEELLSISRLKTGKIQPKLRFLDANHLALKITLAFGPTAEAKGITLENNIPEKHRLFADPTLFYQVLQNLVSNAVKFCRKGDRIRLFIPDGKPSTVAVGDTGVGLEPSRAARLFNYEEKTSTTGTAGEIGTGLGLPLSHDIMLAHGGNLRLESEPGKGATFYAALPDVRPTLLLVEDDIYSQKMIIKMLAPLNVTVITAANGKEALAAAYAQQPHVILSDLIMPVMDGYELIRELKAGESIKDIPVIVLTSAGLEEREKVFMLGADDFVTKPTTDNELLPRVRRFIS